MRGDGKFLHNKIRFGGETSSMEVEVGGGFRASDSALTREIGRVPARPEGLTLFAH